MNIKDLPDEKLVELLCTEVHGWVFCDIDGMWYPNNKLIVPWYSKDGYNPLAPTSSGEAQAFKLVKEFGISVVKLSSGCWDVSNSTHVIISEDLQRAIVLAVLASNFGEEVEV